MNRTLTVFAMAVMLMLCYAQARADDTEIFGGGYISVPPNVLIIFDTSGSMSESVTISGSAADFNPSTNYSGPYSHSYVYRETTTPGSFSQWQYIGSAGIVNSSEISCAAARDALNTYGVWQGQLNSTDPHACSTTATSRRYRTGNYMDYVAGGGTYSDTKINIAKRTLKGIVDTTTGVRFGLMVFNNNEGGRLMAPLASYDTAAQKTALKNTIDSFSPDGWTPLAETLSEAGRYFARQTSWFNSGVDYDDDYDPAIQWRCQKNNIIVMTDGESTQDRNSMLSSTVYLNGKTIGDVDGDFTATDPDKEMYYMSGSTKVYYGSYGSDYLDDVAKFLYDEDLLPATVYDSSGVSFNHEDFPVQNVKTFTIGFALDHNLLSRTADVNHGQGDYFTTTGSVSLSEAFERIISSILEQNAQFISPVVPVNRTNRTYADNGIYLGIFSSDSEQPGLWKGNLKKFGFNSAGQILDRHGDVATDSSGAIEPGAHSVWGTEVVGPEGMTVDIGGVGTILLNDDTRTFYTNTGTTRRAFSTSTVTAAELGLSTDAERDDLVNFVTAADIYDPQFTGTGSRAREWIMGDIIHSQPAVLYDTTNNRNIIFVGANDGFLHCFIDYDQGTSDSLTDDTVEEEWAFMPQDLLPNLKHLPTTGSTALITGDTDHDYFVDGSPVIYSVGSNRYVAFGLRRGSKDIASSTEVTNLYHILNVTNITSPTYSAGVSKSIFGAGSEQLGQSWGIPRFSKIRTSGNSTADVLLLTGGYDTNQDNADPGASDSKGRAVYAVNATTGAPVTTLQFYHNTGTNIDMRYSMVDLRTYDDDDDGYDDVIYSPSVGGDLFVFESKKHSDGTYDGVWSKRRMFSAQAQGGLTSKLRKFLYAPGIAQETWGDWVYIGSGNREEPSDTGVTNRFYAIKCRWTDTLNITDSNLMDITTDDLQGTESSPSTLTEDEKTALRNSITNSSYGWYFDLEHSGEKVVSTPLVYNEVVYFTTFTPSSSAAASGTDPCETGTGAGTARLYAVDYLSGEAVFEHFDGDAGAGGGSGDLTKEDRFTIIGTGIPSQPTLVVTEGGGDPCANMNCPNRGSFIQVGTSEGTVSMCTCERRSINYYYWMKQ